MCRQLGRQEVFSAVKVLVAVLTAGALLLVCACGGHAAAHSSSSASAGLPTPSVLRHLKTGERISLRSGLSLTVPAAYEGYYAAGAPPSAHWLDMVDSVNSNQPHIPLQGLGLLTSNKEGEKYLPGPMGLRRLAASADGSVSVYGEGGKLGTAKGESMLGVVVRLPGRPVGVVTLTVLGKSASLEPHEALAQLGAMWRRFAIRGAELPPDSSR